MLVANTLLLAGGCASHSGQRATQWEYQKAANAAEASKMEQKGWIIAGFSKYADANGEAQTAYIMKKPKQ